MSTEVASVPLPPVDAEVSVICCEYCPVACGYKVCKWPEGTEGGRTASENALGVDFPTGTLSGRWPSQNMHTVIEQDGQATNVIIIPDADSEVVNVGGTHSVRGGALAKKLYTKDGLTHDRYMTPMLKVNGEHVPISWDDAIDLVARLSEYTLETWDELAWGFKLYSYQFYENVFAATKLVLGEIATPNISPHHAPADGDDVPDEDLTELETLAGESALGDVIADAQLAATASAGKGNAVVAFMNPGGIRADITYAQSGTEGDGNVTYAEAFTTQPLGNSLVTMTLTGTQIDTLLEQQWVGQTGRRILQVSDGFTYEWDASKVDGEKIAAATIKIDGTPVVAGSDYRVTVNSFLASGGDNFSVLVDGTERLGGEIDLDALITYFGDNSPVPPGPQDRISVVGLPT
jgi:hypothetical protein